MNDMGNEPMRVRLVDGRSVIVPPHADVDLWVQWVAGTVDLKDAEWAEAVAFWSLAREDPDLGEARNDLIRACRARLRTTSSAEGPAAAADNPRFGAQ